MKLLTVHSTSNKLTVTVTVTVTRVASHATRSRSRKTSWLSCSAYCVRRVICSRRQMEQHVPIYCLRTSRKHLLYKIYMVQPIQLDEKRRLLFKKLEGSRAFLKSIIRNKSLSQSSRSFFIRKLHEKPRNSSKVRIRNRCILTGRGRGVLKEFRISRIKFRELASQGLIPGVTKTSW